MRDEEDRMVQNAASRLFIALDLVDPGAARDLVVRLAPLGVRFKIGMELFYRHGPSIVRTVQGLGGPVLLDLKLHDIPRTVAHAVASIAALEPWGVTVHAAGGPAMLRAAAQAARVRCLAVTVLTSLDGAMLAQVGVSRPLGEQVARLARLAMDAGCAGVVASPLEAADLRRLLGTEALIVTPGVRPAGVEQNDQARHATPGAAFAAGADFLVIGRPVTEAADPETALRHILAALDD